MNKTGGQEDVDEIAVERACRGDKKVPLNRLEVAAAWKILERRRLTAQQIADRLGVTQRTVNRWRSGKTRPVARGQFPSPSHYTYSCKEPGCDYTSSSGHVARHRRRHHPEMADRRAS